MKILMIGDIVREPGIRAVRQFLKTYRKENNIDLVIANGENADGDGIKIKSAKILVDSGIDIITIGNHGLIKEADQNKEKYDNYLLPALNKKGSCEFKEIEIESIKKKAIIINLLGKINMGDEYIPDPFESIKQFLQRNAKTNIIIIDMHAESNEEKKALGYYLDGKVSAVLGTHTHVPTADVQIFEKGTAYVTDVGMVGAYNSVIGVTYESSIKRFLLQRPIPFDTPIDKTIQFNSILIEIDPINGKAIKINRIDKIIEIS
jgi:hypothetical protein